MSYGNYPYPEDDPLEREYAADIARRMENQYWDEIEAQHEEAMRNAETEGNTDNMNHENSIDEPMNHENSIDEPMNHENSIDEPMNHENSIDEPMDHENSIDEPMDHENSIDEPMDHENSIDETLIPAHELLHLPMSDNDANAATVGEYLGLLLSTLWLQQEGFSGKRPFGNSDWTTPVYLAMGRVGIIDFSLDEDGYIEDFTSDEETRADEMILQAIRFAYYHG